MAVPEGECVPDALPFAREPVGYKVPSVIRGIHFRSERSARACQ